MKDKLYKKFDSSLDLSKADYVIIGSGIGGLTTATWLAKGGKKVIVLEQHYIPGGFTHSFKRKNGFEWDVGVHYVGNVGKDDGLRKLFAYLTNNKLKWQNMGSTYDIVHIGNNTYEFKAGKEPFREQLKTYFPDESNVIDQYLTLIEDSNKKAQLFFAEKVLPAIPKAILGKRFKKPFHKYSDRTTYDVLSSITQNEELIAVLCAQCGDYGLPPKQSSFSAHALVIGHFMEGGYFPQGGAYSLCESTIETITNFGGEVYINAKVDKIVTKRKKVEGLQIEDNFYPCKNVISNIGSTNTFGKLLSEEARDLCNFDLKKAIPSTGHLCLYIGLDQDDKTLYLPKYNVWSFANSDLDENLTNITLQNAANKFSYISFPSSKDLDWQTKNPNTATIQALTLGDYNWFKEYENKPWMKRGDEYKKLKNDFEVSMLNRLYELFPQIKGHVTSTVVSTPLSTKHFTGYKHGEIYGLAHTPERFRLPFLRPETKIKGLRLVGQDITLVGVAGAMMSGMLCAITILKWKVWKAFKEMSSYE